MLRLSGGDGHKLLNVLELVVNSLGDNERKITNELVLNIVQQNMAMYDKSGEMHYDIISAFIKSIRGSGIRMQQSITWHAWWKVVKILNSLHGEC